MAPPRKRDSEARPADARADALRMLARREHSATQLQRKLTARGFDDGLAAEITADLSDRGWQSDARFAETLMRSRAGQGYGPLRIRAELKAARVPDAEIHAAFEAVDHDFFAAAIRLRERRFGPVPERGPEWQKQYRFLAARGFDSGQIRAAMQGDPND